MSKENEYFIVYILDQTGMWHSGSLEKFCYVNAGSPQEAANKIWERKEMDGCTHLDCEVKVYATADDYHKKQKPLAQLKRKGDYIGD